MPIAPASVREDAGIVAEQISASIAARTGSAAASRRDSVGASATIISSAMAALTRRKL